MSDKENVGKPVKTMKIYELPIYGEPQVNVKLQPEEIGKFREGISVVRGAVWRWLDSVQDTTDAIKDKYEIGKAHTQATIDYIQNDEGVLPRLTVIGVSGLAGIILGYKGGPLRKAVFGTFGVTAATALCYPNETVAVTIAQYDKIKSKIQGEKSGDSSEGKNS